MNSKQRLARRATVSGLLALVVGASIVTGCDSTGSESEAIALEAVAGDPGQPTAGAGRSRLPEAGALDREIPGITPLAVGRQAAEPDPEPQPEPTTTPPPKPEPEDPADPQPEPTTTPPPEPEPEPPTAKCEGYRVDDLLFESGSAQIAADAAASFKALVALIPTDAEVAVVGHTDSVPASMGNQKLSELRAQAVADAMVEAGLPPSAIVDVAGRADTEPVASNETTEGRQQNRRVEVFVNCPIDTT